MYLKNLTVFGFKSFADKTSLGFQPGVTAIVGPNGCGKSNVADAIRWVLGEQSAKALRGGEMADVIFNGTDNRKPLGLAEVSITLGDVNQDHLKAAGIELTYDEVTVTRRVFRDGGSEYFLNKTPCRLRDIQQLFMGTGVGRASYSIMAQGNITQILSSKPEERRLVFEEAAGITRFKAQKREALRKLESTEQNLLRVDDLIREVKRQMISLQRQAGKARRYKQFQVELQHLDTQLARHQFDVLQTDLRESESQLQTVREQIESGTGNVARDEEAMLQLRARLTDLEHEISEHQQRGLQVQAEIEQHQGRIQMNEQRVRELVDRNAQALQDIALAQDRRLATEQELANLQERLGTTSLGLEELRQQLEDRRQTVAGIDDEMRSQQDALRQGQNRAFAAAQDLSRARNERNALDLQLQGNAVRLEKLAAERVQLEEERNRLAARLEEFQRESEADQQTAQSRRLTVEERQQRLRELHQELQQVTQTLDVAQREQAEKRSRLNVLEQLVASHEGFSAGALAALKDAEHVLGTFADRLRVPTQHVGAIEAALGHHLQLLLTEQPEAAQGILADLSTNKRGRASVASLALRHPNGAVTDPLSSPPINEQLTALQCIPALEAIEAEESVTPLLRALLGRTQIVPDLVTATTAWRESHGEFDFVTPDGELLSRHGIYTGGSTNGTNKAPTSILERKNQVAELQSQLAVVQETVNEASRHKGALQSEQTALQASLQEAQSELRAQEVAIATRQGEFKALQNAHQTLLQKLENVGFEIETLTERAQEGEVRRTELAARLTDLETQEQTVQQQLAELNGSLEALRERRETANTTLTEAKVALATEEQLVDSLRNQQHPLEQRLRELSQRVDQRRHEIDDVVQRKATAETEISESRHRIDARQIEREQLSARTAGLLAERDAQAAEIEQREQGLRARRQHLTDWQEQRRTIEVELAQKQMSLQNLRERIAQKYQVNLDEIRSECITITLANEGPAKIVTLTPEEMETAGVATDWEAVAEQVRALQKRIDDMGAVNLVAIEEYEEIEQRFQFLSTQQADLVKAKEQLIDAINRVNTQTRAMFSETFQRIRENFASLFVEIFAGGKADLFLADEGDVLESGIEIMARPPGKKLQSISLLSGGEQTMTAVALLFAIYQVKPSPFCVLDELDAPLDESNINRFIRVLQRFLVHSQFVVITHNKRTIGMAAVLYGVTMQERGVSKIVSVKFHKTEEAAPTAVAHPLVDVNGKDVEVEEDAPHRRTETLEVAAVS